MNGALTYMMRRRAANTMREMVRKPGRLIYFLVLAALVIFSASGTKSSGGADKADITILNGCLVLFYTICFVVSAKPGLSSGAAFFSMSDVNLIFTSPADNRKVLFCGLIRQFGATVLLGLLLVFQYAWLNDVFGVTPADMAYMIIGYIVAMFLGQLTAMVLYMLTNGRDRAVVVIKAVAIAVLIGFAVYLLLQLTGGGMKRDALIGKAASVISGKVVTLLPVGGWIGAIVSGLFSGAASVIHIVLLCAFAAALAVTVAMYRGSYYEDVLAGAEAAQSVITAKKEGRQSEILPKRVRMGKIGLGHGWGPSAFYFKNAVEARRYRIFILNGLQLMFGAITIVTAAVANAGIYLPFFMAMYFQMFTAGTGSLSREFERPYIYMAPYSSFKKLVMCLGEPLRSAVAESIVVFIPVCIICGCTALDTVFWILLRISCGLVFIGANLICQRLFGSVAHKTYVVFFYLLICMLALAPAAAFAIFAVASKLVPLAAGMLIITAINTAVAAICVVICRNMLADGASR